MGGEREVENETRSKLIPKGKGKMKKIRKWAGLLFLLAFLLAPIVAQSASSMIEVKHSGPSGTGNMIFWCPTTGITNLVIGTNGVIVLTVPGGSGIVYTNASLTVTRQLVASMTNATVAVSPALMTNGTVVVTLQTAVGYDATGVAITNAAGASILFVTNVTAALTPQTVTATATVTKQVAPVMAVTNVVLSNP